MIVQATLDQLELPCSVVDLGELKLKAAITTEQRDN